MSGLVPARSRSGLLEQFTTLWWLVEAPGPRIATFTGMVAAALAVCLAEGRLTPLRLRLARLLSQSAVVGLALLTPKALTVVIPRFRALVLPRLQPQAAVVVAMLMVGMVALVAVPVVTALPILGVQEPQVKVMTAAARRHRLNRVAAPAAAVPVL